MDAPAEHIHFDIKDRLGVITLDRPKALNALTLPMVDALGNTLKVWRHHPDVDRILIKAVPGRAFCAGGDIRAAARLAHEQGVDAATPFLRSEYQMNWLIADCPKPYIALMDGITMGGGVGVSIHGRYRVATEDTLFAMPETGIGFFTDIGGSYFLPRLPRHAGFYLGLTGVTIGPGDCTALGIATHFLAADKLAEAEAGLATGSDDIDACLKGLASPLPAAPLTEVLEKIERWFEPTNLLDVVARLEHDPSDFAKDTLALLRTRSPLSLHVVFELLKRGRDLDLPSCLQMEFALVHRFFEDSDFFEGVRAALIDKDRNPRWQHSGLDAVDASTTAWYFTAPVDDPLSFSWA